MLKKVLSPPQHGWAIHLTKITLLVGVGDGVGLAPGVCVILGVLVTEDVIDGVVVLLGVLVTDGVGLALGVCVILGVLVTDGVIVLLGVLVTDGVNVTDGVGVGDNPSVGVTDGVTVLDGVLLGVIVGVGVGHSAKGFAVIHSSQSSYKLVLNGALGDRFSRSSTNSKQFGIWNNVIPITGFSDSGMLKIATNSEQQSLAFHD